MIRNQKLIKENRKLKRELSAARKQYIALATLHNLLAETQQGLFVELNDLREQLKKIKK
jgi:flagellar hook-associated protein FlgK